MKTTLRLTLALLLGVMLFLCLMPMAFAGAGDYTIPTCTTIIEDGAFAGCAEMKTVTIPAGVTRIGFAAFLGTNLTDVFYEGTAAQWMEIEKESGNGALTSTAIHFSDDQPVRASGAWGEVDWTLYRDGTLTISGHSGQSQMKDFSSSESTGAWRQYRESVSSVIIVDNVTSIGDYAFIGCTNLSDVTISDSVTSIGKYAFSGCRGLISAAIPDSVSSLGTWAFAYCSNLTDVTIGKSVASIGANTFIDCTSLMSVTIPNAVTSIDNQAFNNCSALTSVTIGDGVTSIGNQVFWKCTSLTSLTIGNKVTSIGEAAFTYCSGLSSVTIPNSVTSISDSAFANCTSLTSVTIPESVTSLGSDTFKDCTGLMSVTILGSMTNSNSGIFKGCTNLTSVTLGSNVTDIGQRAFEGCTGLTSVTIPDGVTSIGNNAFFGCTSLKSVTIPGSLTRVGAVAFGRCSKLEAIYYSGDTSQWGEIYVDGSRDSNQNDNYYFVNAARYYNCDGPEAEGKKTLFGIIRQGEGWALRWIVTYQEQDGQAIDPELTIRMDGVDTTGTWKYTYLETDTGGSSWLTETGFAKTAFKKITVRGTAQNPLYIVPYQFYGYSGITEANLSHVYGIDTGAFEDCASLARVDGFDSDLVTIAPAAFKNDVKLRILYGDNYAVNLKYIGDEAFMNTKLMSFNFCNKVEEIGPRAFYNAILGSITLGRNVEEIGAEAFAQNHGLTIYCYRDSEALRYAEDENIAYELLDGYRDHVVFRGDMYKENNTLTNVSFEWGFNLFENASSAPNKNLAIASLVLAADAYDWDLLQSEFKAFGFENPVPHRYDGYDSSIDHVAFGIASQVELINGVYTNIIVVACRGSNGDFFSSDDWQSNITNQADGFSYAATDVHNRLLQYINDYVDTSYPTKLLITGHSRGAAVANILGTMVSDITSSDNVYVYTFACPNTTDNTGRDNYSIFNIVVDGDPVPYLPSFTPPPFTCDDNKYGKTVILKASCNDAIFIRVFQDITGGVSTAAIDNNADCVCGYPGPVRHHVPAVYLACLLEPCWESTGYQTLVSEIDRKVTYSVSTFSRKSAETYHSAMTNH